MNLDKYIYSHCIHPIKVMIWDAHENCKVPRMLPCGHCLHCRMTKMNEWVTRLYAQQRHSQFTYFITLDYAPFNLIYPAAAKLSIETAAVEHNLNINSSIGLHPILLVRNHLDDFLKRLRKSLGFRIQYFACGEYGSKFGRPHFHAILFSNYPITIENIQDAWTIDGYPIGRVDFHDLVLNGTTRKNKDGSLNKYQSSYVFKYVCKYLMKGNFDFDTLATIDFHKCYFNSLQKIYEKVETLFPELVQITDSATLAKNWKEYCKTYSPFVSCSRRPAIGLQYLQENVDRFKDGDFRLFGLSKECSVFPRYFLRKAKESACSLRAIGEISNCPTSSARMSHIASLLASILDTRLDISNMFSTSPTIWSENSKNKQLIDYVSSGERLGSVYKTDLSFYDVIDKIMFVYNGYDYTLWQKSKGLFFNLGTMDVLSILKFIDSETKDYLHIFVERFRNIRISNDRKLNECINFQFDGDYEKFYKYVYDEFKKERSSLDFKQTLINNSHIKF